MQLQLQNFTALVQTQAAAASASCAQLIDVTVGSVLRAIMEANAAVALWMQWLIVEVLATTRAATSNGTDLDSWVADFGMSRLASVPAAGQVTFSRATAGLASVVPVGALVRTGTDPDDQIFTVSTNTTNAAWTGAGYALAATALSVNVPVVAQTAGQAGNVQAGSIVMLASAIPGVDSVSNNGPMLGGMNAESDIALRARFSGFIDSRTRATAQAVGFAVLSIQQGLSYAIAEGVDTTGAVRPGNFVVTVDDGTGSPPATLLAQVSSAIDAIRPIGGTFSVRPPQVVSANIQMTIVAPSTSQATVQAAVLGFVSGLTIGAPLILSKLYQVAHDADPAVTSVTSVTINAASTDLDPPNYGLVRPGTVSISS